MTDRLKPLLAGLGPGFEKLARQAAAAATMTTRVQQALPPPLGVHVLAAARKGDDLVIIVDSAAWSARVRYAGERLKAQLADGGETVAGKVRVRVGRRG